MTEDFSDSETSAPTESLAPMLTWEEARLLGCLLEKEITTPDYYPMTMNGMLTACNQKSNRQPVVEWDETVLEHAMDGLRRKKIAAMISMAGSRGPKYKHTIEQAIPDLERESLALLCELLVRGRQTLGELRTNADRMRHFPDLESVEATLQRLMDRPAGALVMMVPPGAGRKVKSYQHLLCGETVAVEGPAPVAAHVIPPPADWKEDMEKAMAALTQEMASLREELADLRRQLGA